MKQSNVKRETFPYNKAVRSSYFQILKEAKAMLSTIKHEELRYTLVREEKAITSTMRVLHEFVNPLIYLRLECDSNERLVIHYGFEQINDDSIERSNSLFYEVCLQTHFQRGYTDRY